MVGMTMTWMICWKISDVGVSLSPRYLVLLGTGVAMLAREWPYDCRVLFSIVSVFGLSFFEENLLFFFSCSIPDLTAAQWRTLL